MGGSSGRLRVALRPRLVSPKAHRYREKLSSVGVRRCQPCSPSDNLTGVIFVTIGTASCPGSDR